MKRKISFLLSILCLLSSTVVLGSSMPIDEELENAKKIARKIFIGNDNENLSLVEMFVFIVMRSNKMSKCLRDRSEKVV